MMGSVVRTPSFGRQGQGLERVLGELEAAVMETLWQQGPLSIAQVRVALAPRELAFNTVMTVLHRLAEKGLLKRDQTLRRSVYSPLVAREVFVQRLTREVAGGLVRDFGQYAVAQFVAALEQEDPRRLSELEALLKARRGGQGEPQD